MWEWLLRDGKESSIELVNQALDVVDAGALLDEIASLHASARAQPIVPARPADRKDS
jgi:hypothetical protein